jgi:fructokinase
MLGKSALAILGEVLFDCFPDQLILGGAPFNVACHLHAFGCAPLFISRIGQDDEGQKVIKVMTDWGLTTKALQTDNERSTGKVAISFEGDQHHFEILPDQAYDYIDQREIDSLLSDSLPELLYFGTLIQRNQVSEQALKHFLDIHPEHGVRFLDINLRAPWYNENIIRQSLNDADIVKMNDEELRTVASLLDLQYRYGEDMADQLIERFQLQQLLVTCGKSGAWLIDEQREKHVLVIKPASGCEVPVIDTVGAGDAFSAVYILGLLNCWSTSLVLERAHQFASAVCRIRGALPEDRIFYTRYIEEWFT